MPASEIGWSSPPTRGPVLQVYGTKRRADREADVADSIQEEISAKRLCTVDMTVGSQIHSQPMQEEQEQRIPFFSNNNNDSSNLNYSANNNVEMPSHNFPPSSLDMQAQEGIVQPSIEVGAHLGWTSLQQRQPPPLTHSTQAGDGMIMDMNGETYSCQSVPEVDGAHSAMESDCTPNPQQYYQQRTAHSEADSRFCQSYCGAGDTSPTSGRVRCFCKPSWEGMTELRPYISDVY